MQKMIVPYAVAVAAVAVMAAVRYLLDPLLGDHHPFVLFLAAIFFSAWCCGWKSGSLALVLGLLTASYFFVHPRGSFHMNDVAQQVGCAVYFAVGISSIFMVETVRAAKRRSEAHALALQDEISQHERTQAALRAARDQLSKRVEQRTTELDHSNNQLGQEVVARRRAEGDVRRLAALVASSEDAIIAKDLDGIITDWNAGAEHLFGYTAEEVIGQPISLLIPLDRRAEMAHIIERLNRQEAVHPFETVRLRKDGIAVSVSVRVSQIKVDGGVIGVSSINRDLTEIKKLEEQVRQSQKLEAVGQLAGGVAHDFNNLLTVINGYSEILLGRADLDKTTGGLLEEIHKAGNRATSLTRQLLMFSRRQVLEPKVVDLNEMVRHVEKMLHRLIGEDVKLTTVLDPNLGHVKVDLGQMEQVLVNLAVNSRDAMPQGGKITVETANVDLDEAYADTHLEVLPGRYVLLAVSDTGTGMDEKTKARIFEPFFTTKEPGKGTGLGLAVVHGILKQSAGHIQVYSEPGHGTTFKIYLPQIERVRSSGKSHPGIGEKPRGTETVLLVEDEAGVRRLARQALATSGYTVLEAAHGGEGVRVAEKYDGPIHLLISDVVMPEMGGRLLAERLTESRPGMKVLFLSGYTDDAVVRHGVLESEMPFLPKPFTLSGLSQKVREVLDQERGAENRSGVPGAGGETGIGWPGGNRRS